MKRFLIIVAGMLFTAAVVFAQQPPPNQPNQRGPRGLPPAAAPAQPGTGQGQQGRANDAPWLLLAALDTNHDGIIEASELANAVAELRKLDKNRDGRIERSEYMSPPPRGQQGQGPDGQMGPPPNGQSGHIPGRSGVSAQGSNRRH